MIVSGSMQSAKPATQAPKMDSVPDDGGGFYAGRVMTKAKQAVGPEISKRAATVYRCSNGISDDIASMPLQQFQRGDRSTQKIDPDAVTRNMAYLLEIAPNRYMTPFVFKKTVVTWLQFWGNALIWLPPPPSPRELFILPTNRTAPKQDANGNLWYEVRFPNGETKFIPAVEVLHIMVNSTNGIWGRSILEYARETVGLRMGMAETQSNIQAEGLNPAAYMQFGTTLDKPGRDKIREAYSEAISGSEGAGRLAVFDNKVVKFEPITMKLTDAQFLESIGATDLDIANFFKYPAYKLNMGKQSYESNEQQDLDYLKSTLDPHLVQWEQAARLRWLPEAEQRSSYFKFIRESVLRTNAKSRAELHEIEIRSGMLTPNEAREHEDRNSYNGGDEFWMTANNTRVSTPVAVETE
jgi:HK97 family phage portal protein